VPEVYHYHPEAFEDEDWAHELEHDKVKPDELLEVAKEVSSVRDYLLKRSIEMEAQLLEDPEYEAENANKIPKKLYRSKLSA
jgi:hypothetical protein